MLHLAPAREGWTPAIVRTVATENKGIEELAQAMDAFRKHFEASRERQTKKIAHWKQRLVDLIEARVVERVLGDPSGEKALDEMARAVAERRKDPYAAVSEILSRAGL